MSIRLVSFKRLWGQVLKYYIILLFFVIMQVLTPQIHTINSMLNDCLSNLW